MADVKRLMIFTILFTAVCALFVALKPDPAFAANDRYWVGGNGTWTQTTHWSTSDGGASGASVPNATSDVHFTAASAAASFSVTFPAGTSSAKSLDFSTLDDDCVLTDGSSSTITISVSGSVTLSSRVKASGFANHNEWLSIIAAGTLSGVPDVSFISDGPGLDIAAAVTLGSDAYMNDFKFTSGSLTMAGFTMTVGGNFTGAGQSYTAPIVFNQTGRAGVNLVSGANTFTDITINNNANTNLWQIASDQIITGTLTVNGTDEYHPQWVGSSSAVARTITAANVVVSHANIYNIAAAGAADWDLSSAGEDTVEVAGCSGITFTVPYDANRNYYWTGAADGVIGGSGDWPIDKFNNQYFANFSSTSGDSGGSHRLPPPGPGNNVYIDANSGLTGGSHTISFADATDGLDVIQMRDFDITGSGAVYPLELHNGSSSYINYIGINGDLILEDGAVFSGMDGWRLRGSGVIDMADVILDDGTCGPNDFDISGTYTLQSDLILMESSIDLGITGTLNTNGYSIYFLGSLTGASFEPKALASYDAVYVSGGGPFAITASCTIGDFSYTGASGAQTDSITLSADVYFTDFAITGFSQTKRVRLQSSSAGTQRQLSASGTVLVYYTDISDNAKVGAGDPDISYGYNSDLGGNLGWIFTTGINVYWVGNSGSWSDLTNHWSSTSGGSPGTGRVPLIQDTAIFDEASFTIPGRTLTIDITNLSGIYAADVTNTPTISKSGTVDIYGDVTLGTLTWTVTTTRFTGLDTGIVSSSTLNTTFTVAKNAVFMSTLYLGSNITVSGGIVVSSGTFNHNGWDLTASTYDSSTTTYDRAIRLGSGSTILNGTASGNKWVVNATKLSLFCESSTIKLTNSGTNGQTFAGASQVYNNVVQAGAGVWTMTISGSNTVYDLIIDRSEANKTISGAVTVTISGLIMDLAGANTITITNTDFTMASGIVLGDYLIISGSAAAGGATFFANVGGHSTNNGSNSGWIWTAPTAPTVDTLAASGITPEGATLNGELLTTGSYISFRCYFQYGPTVAYGYETVDDTLTGIGTFDDRVSPYHPYHYRAVVEFGLNDHAYGDDVVVNNSGAVKQSKAAVSDPGSGPGDVLVSDAPDAIGNMYTEGSTGGIPLAPLLDPALSDADVPVEVFWYPIAFLLAIFAGLVCYGLTKSPLIQAAVSGGVMAAFCGGGILGTGLLPYLTVVVFGLEAVLILILQEKQNV